MENHCEQVAVESTGNFWLNGMIEPSRIFPKEDRELRRLTRAREGYVNDMTREKNQIHHALEGCGIKLSSVLSDIFGKSGQYILNSLLKGIDIEDIIEGIPVKRIKKNRELYLDEVVKKIKLADIDRSSLTELSLEEMIGLLVKAGYEVRKGSAGSGG